MNEYKYIDTMGQSQTVTASNPQDAMSKATNRNPSSGVQLAQPMVPNTPTPQPTQPVQQNPETNPQVQPPTQSNIQGLMPVGQELGYDTALSSQVPSWLQDMNASTDPMAYRQNYVNMFQDRINALNQIYDQQLATAQKQGEGRVGSGSAVLSRRGLAGSPRGGAIRENILDQNRDIESAIQNERNIGIQQILGEATRMSIEEAREKRMAKESSTQNYLEYLKGEDSRRDNRTASLASLLLSKGIDLATLAPNELQELLTAHKVNGLDLQSAYQNALAAQSQSEFEREGEMLNRNKITSDMELAKAKFEEDKRQFGMEYALAQRKAAGTSSTGETINVSPAARNIIDQVNKGVPLDDLIKGSSNAAQALRNEVLQGLSEQGGYTAQAYELFEDGIQAAKDFLDNEDYKKLGGYSSRLGGQFTPGFGDAKERANQVSAIIGKDNLGLMKGVLTDADRAFLISMSTGFREGELVTEDFIKERLENIKKKLEARRATGFKEPEGGVNKTIDDYRDEFPGATEEELQALMEEEGNL